MRKRLAAMLETSAVCRGLCSIPGDGQTKTYLRKGQKAIPAKSMGEWRKRRTGKMGFRAAVQGAGVRLRHQNATYLRLGDRRSKLLGVRCMLSALATREGIGGQGKTDHFYSGTGHSTELPGREESPVKGYEAREGDKNGLGGKKRLKHATADSEGSNNRRPFGSGNSQKKGKQPRPVFDLLLREDRRLGVKAHRPRRRWYSALGRRKLGGFVGGKV